jgi:hypothetical protein
VTCPLAPEHGPTNRWRWSVAWVVARLRDIDGLSVHALSPCCNEQSPKPARLMGFPSKRCRRLRCWGDTPGCAARDRSRVMKRRLVSLIERNVNSVYRNDLGSRYDQSGTAAGAFMEALCSDFKEVGTLDVNAPRRSITGGAGISPQRHLPSERADRPDALLP